MWPKLQSTLGFLVAFGVVGALAKYKQKRFAKNIRATNTGIVDYLFAMAILLLGFVEFWFLTRIFPTAVIACLVVASLTGVMIYSIMGAIAGFGLQQEKVKVLTAIWGGRHLGASCLLATLFIIAGFVVAFGSLYVFWKLPIGSTDARVWIAFFLFIVPQLTAVLVILLVVAPMVTSEYIDDDVRNSYISSQFSNIIYSTVGLVFPIWVFRRDIVQVFHVQPPPWLYGLVLSIPLLVFLLGGVFPFVVGTYRYRSMARSLLKWRVDWLKSVQKVLSLPKESPQRSHLFEEKLAILAGEIKQRLNENELLKFYKKIHFPEHAAFVDSLVSNDSAPAFVTPDVSNNQQLTTPDVMPPSSPLDIFADPFKEIRTIIEQHKNKLHEWDVQFHDSDKLIEISRSLSGLNSADTKDFIETELRETNEQIAALNPKRNRVTAWLLGLLSTSGSWFFTAHWGKVLDFIGKLASSH